MKMTRLAALILTIAVALFVLIPNLSWAAEDGAAFYKAKCAMCHGPNGEGKPAVKLSDNYAKALGTPSEIERYRRVFGTAGVSNIPVIA